MALPSSGAISLLDLQNEYGGSSPISINEYYRNGAYVPNSIGGTVREPSSGEYYSQAAPVYTWTLIGSDTTQIIWNDTALNPTPGVFSSYSAGGYTYYRGSYRESILIFKTTYDMYALYRTYSTSILVNQNVPTSGQISLSNFYGGRKT